MRVQDVLNGEACVHFENDEARAPQVVGHGALVIAAAGRALHLFRRQVQHCAFQHADHGAQHERRYCTLLVQGFSQAEVSQFDFSAAVVDSRSVRRNRAALHEDVLRFDVPVQPLQFVM